ncbi:MAG: phage holin, LLH family [Tumebacillaceae bacterium]
MTEVISSHLHELVLVGAETLLLVILGLFQRWKAYAMQYYHTKTTATQREWLRLVGVEAFHYAERAFAGWDGQAKLNEAVKYVLDRAHVLGIDVSYPEIRAVIEKAWSETVNVAK